MNKLKYIIPFAVLLSILAIDFSPKKTAPARDTEISYKPDFSYANFQQLMNIAQAAVTIDPSTTEGKGTLARMLYFLANDGPTSGSWSDYGGGPELDTGTATGFIGMVADFTGDTKIGGGMKNAGYAECTDIPSSGSTSMTDSEGTFTMTMGTPQKTAPTGYTGAGSLYVKRVTVSYTAPSSTTATNFMDLEFNCASTSGWIRFTEAQSSTGRQIEIYFDTTDADATILELYMSYDTDGEKFLIKFQTETGNKWKIWVTRIGNDGGSTNGFRGAVYGDYSTDEAYVFFLSDNTVADTSTGFTDTDSVSTGDAECINFNNGGTPTASTTGCTGLTLSDPGAPISDSAGDFSVSWANNSLVSNMTSLP